MGFFQNLGTDAGFFRNIGQGGGGFMGNFGTGQGALAGWQPFQNIQQGQGLFGRTGGFGSGQGFLSGIGQGGNQFMGQFGTGQGALANWTPFKDEMGVSVPTTAELNALDDAEFGVSEMSKADIKALDDAEYGVTDAYPTTDYGSGESTMSQWELDNLNSKTSSDVPVGLGVGNKEVSGEVTKYGTDSAGGRILDDTKVYDPESNTFVEPFMEGKPDEPMYEYEGPYSQEHYDEFGTPLNYGPQTEEWHEQHKYDPSNPWGPKEKGFFKKNWDKLGGIAGLLGAAGGALAAAKETEGVGGGEYGVSDPLQFYGQDYNNWADVTQTNTGQVPDATSQGLAGFYMPQLMSMLQSSMPNKS
jgi:hypothetical protein